MLAWLQSNNIVPITLEVPRVQSWLGVFHDGLSCFFPSLSSGLLFDIVAARAIALLVRGALWEGKLVHFSWLLFHAEERLCVGTETEKTWASRAPPPPSRQEELPSLLLVLTINPHAIKLTHWSNQKWKRALLLHMTHFIHSREYYCFGVFLQYRVNIHTILDLFLWGKPYLDEKPKSHLVVAASK